MHPVSWYSYLHNHMSSLRLQGNLTLFTFFSFLTFIHSTKHVSSPPHLPAFAVHRSLRLLPYPQFPVPLPLSQHAYVQTLFPSFLTLPPPHPHNWPPHPVIPDALQQSAASGSDFGRRHSIFFHFFTDFPLYTRGLPGVEECSGRGAWRGAMEGRAAGAGPTRPPPTPLPRPRASLDMTPISELFYWQESLSKSVRYSFLHENKCFRSSVGVYVGKVTLKLIPVWAWSMRRTNTVMEINAGIILISRAWTTALDPETREIFVLIYN